MCFCIQCGQIRLVLTINLQFQRFVYWKCLIRFKEKKIIVCTLKLFGRREHWFRLLVLFLAEFGEKRFCGSRLILLRS